MALRKAGLLALDADADESWGEFGSRQTLEQDGAAEEHFAVETDIDEVAAESDEEVVRGSEVGFGADDVGSDDLGRLAGQALAYGGAPALCNGDLGPVVVGAVAKVDVEFAPNQLKACLECPIDDLAAAGEPRAGAHGGVGVGEALVGSRFGAQGEGALFAVEDAPVGDPAGDFHRLLTEFFSRFERPSAVQKRDKLLGRHVRGNGRAV